MAALSVWTNPLLAQLPGITPAQCEEKLRHALREFYLQSRSWRQTLGPFGITAATSLVTPTPPANAEVVWIRDAWFQEGALVTPLVKAVSKITEVSSARPTHFYSETAVSLNLWPTPDTTIASILYVEVALTVPTASSVIPALSETHHYEAIEHGALARLFAMPNKPWTDMMVANRYAQLFRRRCLELRALSDTGYLRTDTPWQFPPFA